MEDAMEKIVFDSGIKEYQINNNGVLRFNPSDPNVYARFFDAVDQIEKIEQDLVTKGESIKNSESNDEVANGEAAIRLLREADKRVKELLGEVFGPGNDFDELLGSINIMAVAANGERVVTNFMNALLPVIEREAKKCTELKVDDAVNQAKMNRAQRRAQK